MLNFLHEPFLRIGLAVGLISAVLCAIVGFFVVLKKVIFIGIAISQAAALGVVLGALFGLSPYISALVLSVSASLFFWLSKTEYDIPKESVVALIYLISAALSIILVAVNPRAHVHGVDIMSGNLLYVTMTDLFIAVAGGGAVLAIFVYFYRQLVFVSYDRETALTSGIDGNFVDFLFYLLLGIIVSISIRVSGLLFVFGSLIIPPMAGFKLFTSINRIITGGITVAVLSVIAGFWLSYSFDLPTSPLIVCFYGILFLASAVVSQVRRS